MSRRLCALPATPALELLPALAAALDGSGPAVLPLPGDPEATPLVETLRPHYLVDDDVALVVATSGSTGTPKGVLLSADALRYSAQATHDRLGGPGQWLLALPASRIAGVQVLVRSLLAGTTPVPVGHFSADGFAAAMSHMDPTARRYTSVVPTQLARLLDAGIDLAGFHAILLGGAAAAPELIERARAVNAPIATTYGMTETSSGCVYDGVPLDGVDVAIGDDGRIRIRGPVLASGYRFGDGDDAFEDGWFVTADLGRLDDDDRLTVLGRADDVIVSGGVNVAPSAVESALADHPAVKECAVFGRADAEWGQRVVAAVVPVDAEAPPSLTELREYVAERAGKPAAPRELVLLGALPLLPSGKLDRDALTRS